MSKCLVVHIPEFGYVNGEFLKLCLFKFRYIYIYNFQGIKSQGFPQNFRVAKPTWWFLGREVLEGLRREFERYERALCSNDVKELCGHIALVS